MKIGFALTFLIVSIALYSQTDVASSVSAGIGRWDLGKTDIDFLEESYNGFSLSAEVDYSGIFASVDFDFAFTEEDVNFFSVGLGAGFILFNGSRITVPLKLVGGGWNIDKEQDDEYGGYYLGVKPGIRFYMTNKLALHSNFKFTRNFFTDATANSPDPFNSTILEAGITYSFITKVD